MNCKDRKSIRLAISCGGTGGHFYPGLSIAVTLKKEGGHAILLLSGLNAIRQQKIANDNGIDAIALPPMPHPGRPRNFFKFLKGYFKGRQLAAAAIKEHNINVVMGMGSFASMPPLLAAKKLGLKIFLHDGNARIGRANRFLSRYAEQLWTAFDPVNAGKIKCPVSVTGMPLRPALTDEVKYSKAEAVAKLNSLFGKNFKPEVPTFLIFGGSQGAQKINLVLPQYLQTLPHGKCQIIHLSGIGKENETVEACKNYKIEHLILPSTQEMGLMYGASDLVISRSGGSSVAEIACFGKAAILIPYPFAAENHQFDNAMFLKKYNGAIVINDNDCSREIFAGIIEPLLNDPSEIKAMGERAHSAHTHDAICEILDNLNK